MNADGDRARPVFRIRSGDEEAFSLGAHVVSSSEDPCLRCPAYGLKFIEVRTRNA